MRARAFVAAVAVVTVLVGCSPDSDPLSYQNRRPFAPPEATYRDWWRQVEECTGRSRNYDGIRWFLADWISGGERVRGQWISTREITILTDHEHNPSVVKHEMLHDLLDGDGAHEHFGWTVCVPPVL